MNLQEANKIRDAMRDLRLQQEKLSFRCAELEARLSLVLDRLAVLETVRVSRKDVSRKAIL